ncbi:cell division cycle-associated protein 3 isoform X2 [Syngnathoides biaculeatus]|uniref:cell division cycle-associated protein 3 isoform X2 n=1 Tax=Syngnathoides biaculeatus TaxID=300417 RepID=UPI002ADE6C3B|nr:cell division cycle-associated protein 3 isoform X2 [Syngnathoides biaculeatus]
MGASESKISDRAATKPEAAVPKCRVAQLSDPRSPSVTIDRTPIQVGPSEARSECLLVGSDPRSPTVGIVRTPVREVMRAKVDNLARRLGMLFHIEAEGKVPPTRVSAQEDQDFLKSEELDSTEPLLTPQRPRVFGSVAEHANLVATPIQSGGSSCSPFVLLEEPHVEVEIETDGVSLEEAEEARESPIHKRLSMSLITRHEGASPSQILAEVHRDGKDAAVVEVLTHGLDHLYAMPRIALEPNRDSFGSPAQPQKEAGEVSSVVAPEAPGSQLPAAPRRLTLDVKSPSQVVFKPQWLGKGFGATGLRARTGQGAKGGSSPLAVSVALKGVNDENKGTCGKQKQKGRSPLQILKESNSARGQPQMKLKGSTPEKPRLGQMDRRLLAVSLNKEN